MKRDNNISIWLTISLGIVSIACIVATVFVCIAGTSPDIYRENTPNVNTSAELPPTYDFGEGYLKSIVFLGDRSIAPLAESSDIISSFQIWGGEGGTLSLDYNLASTPIFIADKKAASAQDAAKEYQPQYMLITVGLDNGVGYCTEEKFKEYYIRLIDSIKESSPDTKIILQSILPVSNDFQKNYPTLSNKNINIANKWISEICSEKSIGYLNTNATLSNDKGYLDPTYDSGDGITLNASGYSAMLDYIRTHGYK